MKASQVHTPRICQIKTASRCCLALHRRSCVRSSLQAAQDGSISITRRAQRLPQCSEDRPGDRACSNGSASTSGTVDIYQSTCVFMWSPAIAGSTLMLASSASASVIPLAPVQLQHAHVARLSQAAELADLALFPSVSVSPFQVLTFLLHHPFITLGVAAALYFLVPALVRAGIRFVVVPAAAVLALYLISLNPYAAADLAGAAFDVVNAHPVETSAVIILVLAFALSPYILFAGLLLLLVTGVPSLPPFLRPMLPAPLVQAQRQASELQQAVQGPLSALGQGISEVGSGMQRGTDGIFDRGTAPVQQLVREYEEATGGTERCQGWTDGVASVQQQVAGVVSSAATGLQQRRESLRLAAEEATRCRREATPAARAACVARQNDAMQ